jgi:alkanesulfonate monooxygenase SsuD/methylene tetrahydromethanopterin reductase-like flavin-dependent oxidoreductase (luciferase family)
MFWKSKKEKETKFLIEGAISKASIGLERASEEISLFVEFFARDDNEELKREFEQLQAQTDKIRKRFDSDGKVDSDLLSEIERLEQYLARADEQHRVLIDGDEGEGPWGFSMAHSEMKSLIALRARI